MTTLYKKDPDDIGRVINEVNPENKWVFTDGIPTRKYDGTSCAIIKGVLYKRFDLKNGRTLPPNSIPCQDPDELSGHHPHWVKCDREDKSNKWHFAAFDLMEKKAEGTYELCGKKVQGNPEDIEGHRLVKHGEDVVYPKELSFDGLKTFLESEDIEGIVFHHIDDGRMCKIRKSDYGIHR